MPEETKSTDPAVDVSKSPAEATAEREEEIQRLRARIRELQAKNWDKRSGRPADEDFEETNDILRDMPGRVVDEASKFARGLTMAYLEQFRVVGEMMTTVADQVSGRNRPSRRTRSGRGLTGRREPDDRLTPTDMATNLPGDIFAGVVTAMDKALDGQRRVADRFNEAYRESDDLDRERAGRGSTRN